MGWLNDHAPPGAKAAVLGAAEVAVPFARADIEIVPFRAEDTSTFYQVICNGRSNLTDRSLTGIPGAHAVMRSGVVLSVVIPPREPAGVLEEGE
jgi:hypothetical protein